MLPKKPARSLAPVRVNGNGDKSVGELLESLESREVEVEEYDHVGLDFIRQEAGEVGVAACAFQTNPLPNRLHGRYSAAIIEPYRPAPSSSHNKYIKISSPAKGRQRNRNQHKAEAEADSDASHHKKVESEMNDGKIQGINNEAVADDEYGVFHKTLHDWFRTTEVQTLLSYRNTQLEPKMADALHFTIDTLDIDNGRSSLPLFEPFFVPVEAKTIRQMIGYFKPQEKLCELLSDSPYPDAYEESLHMMMSLMQLLEEPEYLDICKGIAGGTILANATCWRNHRIDIPWLRRSDTRQKWCAFNIKRRCPPPVGNLATSDFDDYWNAPLDPKNPHITAYIADVSSPEDGRLKTSEAVTILTLATNYCSSIEGWGHTCIPISIVSCSGRIVRVLTAIVDLGSWKTQVHISLPVDLANSAADYEKSLVDVIRWMIPKPAGRTR